MRAIAALLFAASASAIAAVAFRQGEPLLAAAGLGLLVAWLAATLTSTMGGRTRGILLTLFTVIVVVSDQNAMVSVAVLGGALAGWHLGAVADRLQGVRGGLKGRLMAHQLTTLFVLTAAALGFVHLALQRTTAQPFWIVVGLASGALLLTGVWLTAARRARHVRATDERATRPAE